MRFQDNSHPLHHKSLGTHQERSPFTRNPITRNPNAVAPKIVLKNLCKLCSDAWRSPVLWCTILRHSCIRAACLPPKSWSFSHLRRWQV
ncbi:MAG: hypothetical protein SNJ50_10915, partial [Cyanobacteriota bacterium]